MNQKLRIALVGPLYHHNSSSPCLEYDEVIYIDAGLKFKEYFDAKKLITIGDGDSMNNPELMDILYPSEKDKSDLECALDYIKENDEAREYDLYAHGLWGGRFDHHLVNFYALMKFLESRPGAQIHYSSNNENESALMAYGEMTFGHKGTFTVFCAPWRRKTKLTITGEAKYLLDNEEIDACASRTLSNEAHGEVTIEGDFSFAVIFSNHI